MAFFSLILAYLLGSVPFGYIAVRVFKKIDIRRHGSGNIGATNVMRLLGPGLALLVLFLDLAKGAAAVLLARALTTEEVVPLASALAVLIGHCWPVFLGFRGGKGSATAIGVLISLAGWSASAILAVAALTITLTRYVSLGSIFGALSAPLFFWLFGFSPVYIYFSAAMALLITFRHRANIKRLISGSESRLGSRAGPVGTGEEKR